MVSTTTPSVVDRSTCSTGSSSSENVDMVRTINALRWNSLSSLGVIP